ncbi:MAG: GPO family capsid scaffolding protein [Proteobacteria bacterium]|nr:GPO family capsid scaffolding protein [Pseudomonadota bacterium]
MPASLVSNFKRIAQSGPTVDGRVIKPEWLTDMAQTYDPKVYTAKLWIDHMRYASYGSVQALKAEKDGDVTRLYAKISPNRTLLQMNQIWEEKLHFSIEPTEDFAKTGKCYLTGLGMTDEPASLGTDEMRFSKITGRTYTARYPGEMVPDLRDMESMDDDQQMERFGQKLVRWFSNMHKTETEQENKEEPMDKDQFATFKESLETTQQTVASLADSIKKFMAGQNTGAGEKAPDPVTTEPAKPADQFAELKTGLDALGGKFDQILGRLEKVAPGTQFGDTTQPADDKNQLF